MRAQDILGSPPFVALGLAIGRSMPSRFAYWLSRRIAHGMAVGRRQMYMTLRANLSHVVGPDVGAEALDRLAEEALEHAGRTYFDMFHCTVKDYQTGKAKVRIDPGEWQMALDTCRSGRGTIIVGPHTSNFDLAAQWLVAHGVEMQALSLANPNAGTRLLNTLRGSRGVTMTPIDVPSLRLALARLKQGGVVVTGADRVISRKDPPLPFFGQPAPMPTGHIRLAVQTNARLLVAYCLQDPDGYYHIRIHEPLELEKRATRDEEIRHNALRVLAIIEDVIRSAPKQWLMFVPVWEDTTSPTPD
jgi:KDO2-lipid IV(A) lauroyltransferase